MPKTLWRERWQNDLGDARVIRTYRNVIVDHHVDPIERARELGVLAAGDQIQSW